MYQEIEKEYSQSELYQKKVREQLNRLRDILERDMFNKVSEANYMERVKFEKWHQSENERINKWFKGEWSAGSNQAKAEILLKLLNILNSSAPDKQSAMELFNELKDELTLDILMQIVSETRLIAVSNSMKSATKNKVSTTSQKMRDVGMMWLKYEAGLIDGKKHSKNTAAELLSKKFHVGEKTIRHRYLSNIENNPRVFPEGIEAARRELGIL